MCACTCLLCTLKLLCFSRSISYGLYAIHIYVIYNHVIYIPSGGSCGKESTCNTENLGLTTELGRSNEEGNGYALQYSYLENSMDRGAWQATVHGVEKSQT